MPTILLALAHVVLIGLALAQRWQITDVVWIYWCEGIVLGVFAAMRMIRLPNLPAILFFGLPYALFHLFYAVFFVATDHLPTLDVAFVACVAGLLVSHALELRRAFRRDDVQPPHIEHFCALAGTRMLPVMITVGIAVYLLSRTSEPSRALLVAFLAAAGICDVVMQRLESSVKRAPAARLRRAS
jgi:hypothetical protein